MIDNNLNCLAGTKGNNNRFTYAEIFGGRAVATVA